MAHHDLKIIQPFFDAVISGGKKFEIRKNDRNFKEGDTLTLNEWDGFSYTGRTTAARIGFVTKFQQLENNVVFSLLPLL